ncbi:MAG: hypothetical protein AAF513_15260 [Pseudomonadota bacterium]
MRILIAVLAGVMLCHSAAANMILSNVIVHFEPGESTRQDIEIFNSGEDTMYIKIDPKLVLAPGTEQEDRASITNPREAGLLVTPNRLVLPPGATKSIRLVKMGASFDERVYRISAVPVTNGLDTEQTGVKVLVGYEILAIVYPNNPQPELEVMREGHELRVVNNGNTNVLMREGYQCETPDLPLEECTPLPGKRMYPGNEWVYELPHDLPVMYYESIGMKNFTRNYP